MEQDRPPLPRRLKSSDYIGWIVLAAIFLVIGAGVYFFPMVKSYMAYQDCIASGRTDCGRGSSS